MFIERGNVTIRNALTTDAPLLASWWNDGAVMAHAGFPEGLGTTAERIALGILHNNDDMYRNLIIEVDGKPIGEMSYGNVGGGAEIGIKICEAEYQNQGYGKRCLRMLIESLFYDLKFKRIVLDTNAKNKRARHVYESLGFEKTGFHKDIWKDQNGVPQSSVDYELTRERFVKRESLRL